MTTSLPTITSAKELFVFAGAGASYAVPAMLPLFDPMRNEILRQLDLTKYVEPKERNKELWHPSDVAKALAPEPFMLALRSSGVDIESWLTRTLGTAQANPPQHNAVHTALAQLVTAGAVVWTVNFDTLIEEVTNYPVTAVAWPAPPIGTGVVFKPHGSLPGPLIVTSDHVLGGLRADWAAALSEAVKDRTVVFIGYSGRDLDFQPIWDELLKQSKSVLWFDFEHEEEAKRRRILLRECHARSALTLVQAASGSDPSSEFVAWCRSNDLVDIPPGLIGQLRAGVVGRTFPPLGLSSSRAKAAILGLLGDASGARRVYRRMLWRENPLRAGKEIANQIANHGSLPTAGMLWALARIPVVPKTLRTGAERKRLAVYSKLGRHDRVLKGTRKTDGRSVSTLLILRAEALRITASLDEAADIAGEAYRRARSEQHPVRAAHAAFQRALALLWAERVAECRRCLDDELRPSAGIAASRWVAWADFIAGGLSVRDGDPDAAQHFYNLSEPRFRAEGLTDGIVSVQTGRLAVARQRCGDLAELEKALNELNISMAGPPDGHTYYSRGHRFTAEAVLIERAEFARVHVRDLDLAQRLYAEVAESEYPLQRSLGLLGVGLTAVERATDRTALRAAIDEAKGIGARLVVRHAEAALALPDHTRPEEVFFC